MGSRGWNNDFVFAVMVWVKERRCHPPQLPSLPHGQLDRRDPLIPPATIGSFYKQKQPVCDDNKFKRCLFVRVGEAVAGAIAEGEEGSAKEQVQSFAFCGPTVHIDQRPLWQARTRS